VEKQWESSTVTREVLDFLVQLDNTVYFYVLYTLYMFRVFITHPQERHCKLGRRFDNLSMLVVVSCDRVDSKTVQ
jgi:hypothetical protein